MSAAPAIAQPRPKQLSVPGGFTPVPTVVVQNIGRMTPAEFYLACLIAHRPDVTDTMWEEYTAKDVKTKQNAVRGLFEKKLIASDTTDFEEFKRRKTSGYSLDPRGFSGWARHADPRDTRTAGRGPTKPVATPRVHPDCKNGCAMAEGRAQLISLSPTKEAKPVSEVEAVSSDRSCDPNVVPKPQGSSRVQEQAPSFSEGEGTWWKTLAAMRVYFATAGTQLLMMIVAAVLALVPDATDAEIAEAVDIVVRERGRKMEGPGLWVKAVPDVVLREREKRGRRLFATSVPTPVSLGVKDPKVKEQERRFALWDRVCHRHETELGYDMRAIADDPELDSGGREQALGMIQRLGRFTKVPL